ncbi:unnamed protein product, partial [Citrullus colocynthis]
SGRYSKYRTYYNRENAAETSLNMWLRVKVAPASAFRRTLVATGPSATAAGHRSLWVFFRSAPDVVARFRSSWKPPLVGSHYYCRYTAKCVAHEELSGPLLV